MKRICALITFLLISTVLFSQTLTQTTFSYYKTISMSGSATAVTIQHNVLQTKTVRFVGAYLYCSSACVIDLVRDGTAATTTAGIITSVNPTTNGVTTSTATAYYNSNVGSGTTLFEYQLNGSSMAVDLSSLVLDKQTAENLTFSVAAATTSVTIGVKWFEQ